MRARSRWLALFSAGPLSAVLVGSCTDNRGSIGADCLKDEDCVSGVCAQLVCAAGPTYLDSEAPEGPDGEGAPDGRTAADVGARDAASDAAAEATMAPPDAAALGDGATAPADASVDASVEASGESGADDASPLQDAGSATLGADADAVAPPDAAPPDAAQDAVADVAVDAHPDGADE